MGTGQGQQGRAGIDKMPIDDFMTFAREHWEEIRSSIFAGTGLLKWYEKNGHFFKSGLDPHQEVFNDKEKKGLHTGIQGFGSQADY